MTTQSQLIDKMVAETRRPDLRTEICSYVNQTLRELHMDPQRGTPLFYRDNLKEDLLTSNLESGFSWTVPSPGLFQGIVGCRYDSRIDRDGKMQWAKEMLSPNRNMSTETYWFYRSGNTVYFNNYGGLNSKISLSWYEYVKSLKDYALVPNRPAIYDSETETWLYNDTYNVSDEQRALARLLTSNWLLLRWDTVVEEGVRAKVYKRTSDTERARTAYSSYQSLRQGLVLAEAADISGSW